MTTNIEVLKKQIVERLQPLEPESIILFGSHAWGKPDDESDIDLYVVTKDEFIPQDFEQKMAVKLRISSALRDLKRIYDFDLLVHTKAMNQKFVQRNSSFARKICSEGVRLYGQ
ncbi:nucleotidyltransferase domain-containing protein [Desulfurispirillum indicum]|uniref:nucleotidyltransferase domain-containing protein n=1 Tax=Desulfurispirillum indicum TaxID=936456 RepID=UPI001CFBCABD|nr:nucleotidyltransferase domain-containing protein [Desulfurispirillum indicum]UCZ56937.1 nucleotidyltransferase domain-containing protein [Desulfurispirillum indicum]